MRLFINTSSSSEGNEKNNSADRTIKYVNGVKTVETKERHIPPSQPAIEFYLINKKSGDYSRNGGCSGNADGALADILEALKNG